MEKNNRIDGRSAYVCPDGNCKEMLIKKHVLDRSFSMRLSDEVYEKLNEELKTFG